MGNQPVKETKPQVSLKDQVKEYTKQIGTMRREFNRQKYKIEYNKKNLQKQLKRKIEKKEPMQAQKVLGAQILKQNQMLTKYDSIDSQLQNVTFELQQMTVNQSMQKVMQGMANIMTGANSKMKGANYQQTMKKFMTEKERMGIMNEMVEDIMNTGDDQIEDDDVDKLIGEMTREEVARKQKKIELNMDYDEDQMKDV